MLPNQIPSALLDSLPLLKILFGLFFVLIAFLAVADVTLNRLGSRRSRINKRKRTSTKPNDKRN